VHVVPLRNNEREICGATAMTQDITAQKRADAALRCQGDFTSAVLETAAALVTVLDREGHIVQFNRACQETSGYSFDEVKGKSAWENPLLLPEETSEPRAVFSRLAAGQFPNRHENYWLTKDGRRRLIAWSNTALLRPDGSVEYVIGTGIDITEQRRAEEELTARMHQQTAVVELGERALTGTSIRSLLEETVALVANTLALDYCSVLELLPSGDALVLTAGFGWEPDLRERASVPAASGSPAGYALLCHEPVVFDDLQHESRFEVPALLREYGIVSGAVVPIAGRERPFGVLHALSTTRRTFTIHDLRFLQSVANILATAIERQTLEKKVLEASESEQRRIGQDLHDSLCQQLIGGELRAAVLRQILAEKSPADASSAAQLAELFRDLAAHAREIARGLAPVEITEGGLTTALRKLARTVRKRSGIACRVRSSKGVVVSDSLIATHLYRVVQEAVHNAVKHSHASHVSIVLRAAKGKIILTVRDDGLGLPTSAAKSEGMGLHLMRYRAAIINALLSITSGRTGGTTVTCSLEPPAGA
jgi:PAS domain S-box-containing protein